jgi:4-amino-4-deoxy-L-arabinose transferase-like glycosyltransferase
MNDHHPIKLPRATHGLVSLIDSPKTAVLVALFLRIIVLAVSLPFADYRRHHYHSQGFEAVVLTFALAGGHGYSFPFPNFISTAWLAPVYVWILTLGNLLFPRNGNMVILFGQVVNILCSALTCYPIFALGRKAGGRTIGLITAWVWVFLPVAVLMPIAYTWDQSLAALLMAQLFVFSYALAESSSLWLWCGYGALWGVAALTNPSLFLLFPCFAVWLYIARRKSQLPALKPLAISTLACVLVLLPWTARNWYRLGGFTFVKSNFGVELWLGNNPQVKEVWSPQRNPLGDNTELDHMVAVGELKYSHEKEAEAISFIKAHPGTFVRHCVYRFVDIWSDYFDSREDFFIQPSGTRPFYIVFCALFSLAAWAGMVALLKEDCLRWSPLACAVLFFPLPYYVTHSSQRYRHPIDPILTVLAVVGALRIWNLRHARASDKRETVESELKASAV